VRTVDSIGLDSVDGEANAAIRAHERCDDGGRSLEDLLHAAALEAVQRAI